VDVYLKISACFFDEKAAELLQHEFNRWQDVVFLPAK
jgi:hypothetical protein